ncbi:MAG: hypothetical protein LDL31_07640 [Prosthecobacter sp.]|jgi:hypothetical protein|nr:hypothetical protein [Prosthecobacter sp.]
MLLARLSTAVLAATLGLSPAAADTKTFTFTADEWAEGEPPQEVFIVEGKIQVAAKDGNKALVIDPGSELTDACAQVGTSAAGESSIQARVFASKRARSVPKFGVSVHGMSGYRLLVNAAKKQLELVKSDQVAASVPFTWTSDAWLNLKLEVKRGEGDAWLITGKAWPADTTEPAAPTLKAEDKGLKGQGKAGLWGTPYSQTPIYFDDIQVSIETANP